MVWCWWLFLPYLPHCQCSEALPPWLEHLGSCIDILLKNISCVTLEFMGWKVTNIQKIPHWHLLKFFWQHILFDAWIHGLKRYKYSDHFCALLSNAMWSCRTFAISIVISYIVKLKCTERSKCELEHVLYRLLLTGSNPRKLRTIQLKMW